MLAHLACLGRGLARRVWRRALGSLAIAGCSLAALGFATAALYSSLALPVGSTAAAAIIAGAYAIAALAITLGMRRRRTGAGSLLLGAGRGGRAADTEAFAQLVAAFLLGFQAANAPGRRIRE